MAYIIRLAPHYYMVTYSKRWWNSLTPKVILEGQRSQGSVCSPVKAVRELGSERRETAKRKFLALLSKL